MLRFMGGRFHMPGASITIPEGFYLNSDPELVDDFGFQSEYCYHAGKIWLDYIHPDDLVEYSRSVHSVIFGKGEVSSYSHRVRKKDGTYVVLQPRYFILNDENDKPEYFGGILVPQ